MACVEWGRGRNANGYGVISIRGRRRFVHRWVYELYHGPISEGMTIDHLCRNRACVNPGHLEEVTLGENIRRGKLAVSPYETGGTCRRGHALDPANVYLYPDGRRACRVCRKLYHSP